MNVRGKHDILPFITLEDITLNPQAHNYVAWNYVLPEDERVRQFQKIMKLVSHHNFTKNELERLMEHKKPCHAMAFIKDVQSMIYHRS